MYYGGYGMYNGFYNTSYILVIIGAVICLLASFRVKSTYKKYAKVLSASGMTGAQAAQMILDRNGVVGVSVQHVAGELTDHYDPRSGVVNLSDATYNSHSVAAIGVAAHECGHVVQHATGYAPLRLRTALVPAVSFANNVVSWVLLAGVLLINVFPSLIWIGIALFALSTLFSFVTLPVEINASARAVQWLDNAGIVSYETKPMAQDALKWAAYTYVIAAIGSLATLLYYLSLASRRN